ncbi:unnamed protein product [Phaedon cochleariae]|uniref:CCHC-type domain-containing protein n=1 Tax=Phaedon cochleariae TaxID=80249 RepID=A0A9N9X5D8_PHACE|nr:unnamed protein product [Phaedon cochleariae]
MKSPIHHHHHVESSGIPTANVNIRSTIVQSGPSKAPAINHLERSDIAASVSILAKKASKPTIEDWTEVKRFIRYLNGTDKLDLFLSNAEVDDDDFYGYATDANWAGHWPARFPDSTLLDSFLRSKDTVDEFLNDHGFITISDETVRARRLITSSDRLVISNISPTIPHHIPSFRRQVYITPTEDLEIPESIELARDDSTHRIFLARDGQTCFKCKQTGHIASDCPTNPPSTFPPQPPQLTAEHSTMSKTTTPDTISTDTAATASTTSDESSNPTNSFTSKRTVSEILTSTSEDVPTSSVPRTDISRTKKQEQDDVYFTIGPEQLKNISSILNKQQLPCIIDAEQLEDLLENAYGSKDALSVSKDYTKDTTALIKLLTEIGDWRRIEITSIGNSSDWTE